ncbi:hypothetical protein [Thermoanaerobacter sp. YS13]|nr:hypothetical protein [Thermoanaerobacter sp. YS13]
MSKVHDIVLEKILQQLEKKGKSRGKRDGEIIRPSITLLENLIQG